MTEINNLKQQINIYINDINSLKNLNQQLQGENAGIIQQVQHLQGSNNGELNNLRQQMNVYVT